MKIYLRLNQVTFDHELVNFRATVLLLPADWLWLDLDWELGQKQQCIDLNSWISHSGRVSARRGRGDLLIIILSHNLPELLLFNTGMTQTIQPNQLSVILVEETCWSHWVKFKWWFDSSPYLWASFATFDSIQTFELVRRVNTDVVIAHQLHYFWQHSGDCWDLWLSVTSNLIFGILSRAWRPDDNDNVNKGPQGSGGWEGVLN